MRIAIIADTHGNLISLDAVLAEIEREQIEHIVCLGDVAGLGPHPREVLHRLRALDCPVVMGNADEFLLDPGLIDPQRHPTCRVVRGRLALGRATLRELRRPGRIGPPQRGSAPSSSQSCCGSQ